MLSYDDKRNFYRMMVNKEVVVTILDDETNRQGNAICRDLSATGLAVEMSHPVELGTQIRVRIDSGSSNVPSLDTLGKVIRCVEDSPDNYIVGIEIQDMD